MAGILCGMPVPSSAPSASVPRCPHCASDKRQTKAGRTVTGSPRWHCVACDKDYTPEPKPNGYAPEVRRRALTLVLEGMSLRAAARVVGVNPQSVANWLADAQRAAQRRGLSSLPPAGAVEAETTELDEVHVFIGAKRGEKNAGPT